MTQRKKGKKPDPSIKPRQVHAGNPLPPPVGRYTGEGPDDRPRNSDYWRGYQEAQQQEGAKRHQAKQEKAAEESLANSRISVEFGDSTITLRDGLDRMIRRIPLDQNWSKLLGQVMAERGCNNIGSRIGEHALFTARVARNERLETKAEFDRSTGVGPGMDFGQRGGLGGRELC